MSVSYAGLWRLMKDNKMTKRELAQAADFSQYMIGQFTKDAYVSLKHFVKSSTARLMILLSSKRADSHGDTY